MIVSNECMIKNNAIIFKTLLVGMTSILSLLTCGCYAREIVAKYNHETVSFEYPGEVNTRLSLKSKGVRRIGTDVIITDWPEHELNDDNAPNDGVDVRAKCTPSVTKTFGDMTRMAPDPMNISTGLLECAKGQGITIYVLEPKSQDYEYVADLTAIKDQQPATNTTTLYPVLNTQQQLNPKGMEIKTNANPTAAAVQQKGSCKCILM